MKVIRFVFLLFFVSFISQNAFSQQTKTTEIKKETAKDREKPEVGDKIINGKKGPEGQPMFEGVRGGVYYINKKGNRTYLKGNDKVVPGKKGPDGQKVYAGPKGGEYYINKNGNKVYLKNAKQNSQ
jgi:colicin import membrane protein